MIEISRERILAESRDSKFRGSKILEDFRTKETRFVVDI